MKTFREFLRESIARAPFPGTSDWHSRFGNRITRGARHDITYFEGGLRATRRFEDDHEKNDEDDDYFEPPKTRGARNVKRAVRVKEDTKE